MPEYTPYTLPKACDLCGAERANWRQRTYPYWQRYECGRRYSIELGTWGYGESRTCLSRRLADALRQRDALIAEVEVYRSQLARIRDRTTDQWAQAVAVDALYDGELAALATTGGDDA